MHYPVAHLIHTCTILKRYPGVAADNSLDLNQDQLNTAQGGVNTDEYGNPVLQASAYPELRCRFGHHAANPNNSGYYGTTTCTLQTNTDIAENDQVLTETPGYAKVYWVNAVRQIYGPTGKISHTILDLRETEEGVILP